MELSIRAKKWPGVGVPRRVLAIRYQALGDTIITLPYLCSLKKNYPEMEIHFLTRKEVSEVPGAMGFFEKVFAVGGGRNAKVQFVLTMLLLPRLWFHRYDVVLDLQNHKISRIVRMLLFPRAWSEFDRVSPIAAGERTRLAIDAAGFTDTSLNISLRTNRSNQVDHLLTNNGWDRKSEIIILNPAGNLPSRNWPLENYINFALEWSNEMNDSAQFVVMLTGQHKEKSQKLKEALGAKCIDLSGKTSVLDAFVITGKSKLMLTEDSGLMHMAWTQGVPTLALFGSSRKDWSAPLGDKSLCMDSSDLECGPCMLAECLYGDNRCLSRYSVGQVLLNCKNLLTIPA